METDKKTAPQTEEDAPVSSYSPSDRNIAQDLDEIEGDFEGSVADDESLFDKDEDDDEEEEDDELEVDEIELDEEIEEEEDDDEEDEEDEEEEDDDDETKDQTV